MSTDNTAKLRLPKLNQKTKLILILAVEFVAILTILLLILFAGKKTHTVTFDLNGGILISGDLEQRITQGQNATPPTVAKHGHYLLRWSGSYKSITRDVTLKAVWEYETTPGIEYNVPENTNYCTVSGSLKEIQGEVYIGAFYNERQVMGIDEGAFKDRTGITAVYLLDGILAIEKEAFAGCENLEVVEIPSTVVRIGEGAFKDCAKLKEVILPESLLKIEGSAFKGCTALKTVEFNEKLTSIGKEAFLDCILLEEVILHKNLKTIGASAFNTARMTINLYILEGEVPRGFEKGWHPDSAVIIYDYGSILEEETEDEDGKKDGQEGGGLWGDIL